MKPTTAMASTQDTSFRRVSQGDYQVVATVLTFETHERVELWRITDEIAEFVAQSPVREGVVQINSLHTTAGVIINEIQNALLADFKSLLEQLAPRDVYYKHNDPLLSDCTRKNADAHLRAILTGLSLTVPVQEGRIKLGTWQNILLAEFDGPNKRQVHVQVMGV